MEENKRIIPEKCISVPFFAPDKVDFISNISVQTSSRKNSSCDTMIAIPSNPFFK